MTGIGQRHKNITKQFRFIQFKNQAAVLADLQQCRSLTAYSYESQTHAACSECFRSRNVAKASCIENTHTLTVSCFSRKQIGFTFLVPAHPGSPGKGPLTGVCVCYYYYYTRFSMMLHDVAQLLQSHQPGFKWGKKWWGYGMQWH